METFQHKEEHYMATTETAWDITGTGGRCYNLDMMMSGSGGGVTYAHTLNINPDAAEVTGVQYQSIANALTYIGTLTPLPSATNRWSLMVSGTLAENIDLGYMPYVAIVGTENALLTGTINNSNTSSIDWNSATLGSYPWVIYSCTISNLTLTYNNISAFINCTITGGTCTNDSNMVVDGGMITGGNLFVNAGCLSNCLITGGNFGDPDKGGLYLYDVKAFGGRFLNKKVTALNSSLLSLFGINLYGGTFSNCSLSADMNFNNSTQYIFYSCATLPSFDMTGGSENNYTGVSVSLYNTLYSNITIGTGNTLATSNSFCMGDSTVTTNGGVWTQFDNAVSITSGTINGTTIGVTTPAVGNFTSLSASSLILPGKTPLNAIAASGTVEVSDTPVENQHLYVDSVEFHFVTSRSGAGEITISSDAATQAINIRDAITADVTTVSAAIDGAVASQVDLTAVTKGAAGNAIALSTDATGIAVSGTTLAGGFNGTVGVIGEAYADASYIYYCTANNGVSNTNWRRIALGTAY
jgi:hypothetical protein